MCASTSHFMLCSPVACLRPWHCSHKPRLPHQHLPSNHTHPPRPPPPPPPPPPGAPPAAPPPRLGPEGAPLPVGLAAFSSRLVSGTCMADVRAHACEAGPKVTMLVVRSRASKAQDHPTLYPSQAVLPKNTTTVPAPTSLRFFHALPAARTPSALNTSRAQMVYSSPP